MTTEELGRIVDEHWNPPVTASVRLVSIIDDCAQHLGQPPMCGGSPVEYLTGVKPGGSRRRATTSAR